MLTPEKMPAFIIFAQKTYEKLEGSKMIFDMFMIRHKYNSAWAIPREYIVPDYPGTRITRKVGEILDINLTVETNVLKTANRILTDGG